MVLCYYLAHMVRRIVIWLLYCIILYCIIALFSCEMWANLEKKMRHDHVINAKVLLDIKNK